MKKNISQTDRIIRVIIAAVAVTLSFTNVITGTVALVLSALATILVLTSLVNFCPIYWTFGLTTLRKKNNASH